MNIQLREVIFSDNSKAKYLIVNHPNGSCGRVKIMVKQWDALKKMGINSDTVKVDANKIALENND